MNCAEPLAAGRTVSRCWGCGRALCPDCYWRHGVEPSAHRCASCLATSAGAAAVSGAFSVRTRSGYVPAVPPKSSE